MAAIAALSDKGGANRVARLFITRNVAETGCYCLNVCEDGLWKSIIVDDLVPCHGDSGQPALQRETAMRSW